MGLFKRVALIFSSPVRSLSPEVSRVDSAPMSDELSTNYFLSADTKRTWLIRRREFNKLRVLRIQEADTDGTQRRPFFLTSILLKSEERVSTIKKIDEIEAQMSMQWWKTHRLDLTKDV